MKGKTGFSEIKRIISGHIVLSMFALLLVMLMPGSAFAADSGVPDGYKPSWYNSIPHVQMRDVFETGTIDVAGIKVTVKDGKYYGDNNDTVNFRIYNTTTQETEYENAVAKNDGSGSLYLQDLNLKKGHDYIFFVEDSHYRYPQAADYPAKSKVYVQILEGSEPQAYPGEGPGAYDYMQSGALQYHRLTEIVVEKRDAPCEDPFEENRFDTDGKSPIYVYYKNHKVSGVTFKLVSDVETLKAEIGSDSKLKTRLIEGVTYMVYVDGGGYAMDSFPIVAKDKSDYGGKDSLYCYNHTTCVQVSRIDLYDKVQDSYDGSEVTEVKSLKGRSTAAGMNFKSLLLADRILDEPVPALIGKNYELIGFTAINPRRWEISKIVGTNFEITWNGADGRLASHAYKVSDKGDLSEISFKQSSRDSVSFTIDSLSVYPVAIEYDKSKTYEQKLSEEAAAAKAAEKAKSEQDRKAREAVWNGQPDRKLSVPKITKPKAAKKSITVKWKKLSKKQLKKAGNIKIEVQYSTNRAFPMEQTRSKFAAKKKTSIKIKSLGSKKTYYVRIRTFRQSGSVKYVSAWSKIKKVKVK